MSIIRCPHCGTANREGSNFCNSCGVDLRAGGGRQEHTDSPAPTSSEEERPAQPAAPEDASADRQPWLRMDFTAEEDAPPFEEEEEASPPSRSRLVLGIQGLLAPVRVAVHSEETETRQPTGSEETSDDQVDLWRRVRTRMASPPLLAGIALRGSRPPLPNLQIRWLFLVLALTITVPALLGFVWPSGSATQWPGVKEAFGVIDDLPVNANVLIYWAYDPSTAGELDLEALPVTKQLFQQRARMSIVTLLPGGPAIARRLVERARLEWQRTENLTIAAESTWTIPVVYLPGGASMLALVGQNPGAVFVEPNSTLSPMAQAALSGPPDLAIVFAAQADDVQHWLEQVQPLNQAPVVAVVAAGADPVVRPYLDSGQLAGLVSGFDGAYNYQRLLDEQAARNDTGWLDMQLVLQDWGQFVFFLAIVLGNFAAVLGRGQRG